MEPWAAAKKSFKLVWRCHQFPSGFLTKGHLPQVSCQSHLPANDKGDNEMIPGAVHRTPGIYLIAEENPGKSQLGDRRWRLCDHCLTFCPLSPNDVIRSPSLLEKEKGRRRKGRINITCIRVIRFHPVSVFNGETKRQMWMIWLWCQFYLNLCLLTELTDLVFQIYYLQITGLNTPKVSSGPKKGVKMVPSDPINLLHSSPLHIAIFFWPLNWTIWPRSFMFLIPRFTLNLPVGVAFLCKKTYLF